MGLLGLLRKDALLGAFRAAGRALVSSVGWPLEPYISQVYQALGLFRFFAFALGMGLLFVPGGSSRSPLLDALLIICLGLYGAGRVVFPPSLTRRSYRAEIALLLPELGLVLAVVIQTGGLDSPLIIYALAPILSAALFLDLRSSVTLALLIALPTIGAHMVPWLGPGNLPQLLSGNYLAFALLYLVGSLLLAMLPFLTNLNVQERLRTMAYHSERQRLRREVHDEIAQTLAFLSLKVQRVEERSTQSSGGLAASDLRDIAQGLQRCSLGIRDYLEGGESEVPTQPLRPQLASAARRWRQETGLQVRVEVSGRETELPARVKRHLVQIAREAMANAAKHASPTLTRINLEWGPTELRLRVRDDGRGFLPSTPRGQGLNIMQERANLIGASLNIHSTTERGTEVVVVYPYGEGGAPG
jgi:signal transduction histidine kinase